MIAQLMQLNYILARERIADLTRSPEKARLARGVCPLERTSSRGRLPDGNRRRLSDRLQRYSRWAGPWTGRPLAGADTKEDTCGAHSAVTSGA
jgi:hypothetical protein